MKTVYAINLTAEEEIKLLELLGEGEAGAEKTSRIHILLLANDRYTNKQIADALYTNQNTVEWVCKQYIKSGLEHSLGESLSGERA